MGKTIRRHMEDGGRYLQFGPTSPIGHKQVRIDVEILSVRAVVNGSM